MSASQLAYLPLQLHSTIRVLCPLIDNRIKEHNHGPLSEHSLRRELVGCILGSQVRYETAALWTGKLGEAGLLDDLWWTTNSGDCFGSAVYDVLSGGRKDLGACGEYRFARLRSRQLAVTSEVLAALPLASRLTAADTPRALRRALIACIPGLGPKQASMFLRNVGISFELAVLDTHVLRFLDTCGYLPFAEAHIGTLQGYEAAERVLIVYSDRLGYPVGYVDWAIWATMRAVRELRI